MSLSPLVFTGVSTFSTDFQSIQSRQLQIAQIPITQLQNRQSDNTQRKQLLGTLNTAVAALGSSIAALGAIGGNKGLTATSSDASVSVMNTGAAQSASYTVSNIQSLAKQASETSVTGYADSSTAAVSATGSVQLVLGSTSYDITLAADKNNLSGLRDAINASGAGVTASILTTGNASNPNYLVVSANNNGATTLQLNDNTAGGPVALLSHAQPISETSKQTYADATTATVSQNSSMQLVLGGATYSFALAQNNLNGLVSAINSIAGSPVTATIQTSGGRSSLVVTANKIGDTSLQLNDIPAVGSPVNLLSGVNNNANQGTNAVFNLNGIAISRNTNSINDIIPGLTFNLLNTNAGSVTMSLASNRSQLSNALGDLTAKYNAVVDQLDAQFGPNAGLLSADYAIQAVMDDMHRVTAYQGTGSNNMSLAALGVKLDTAGKMSFDPNVLSSLTDSQVSDGFKFLGSSTSGFGLISSQFTQLSDPISGLIKTEQGGIDTANQRLTNQIGDLNTRISVMQHALTQQLQRADAAVSALQSQQQMLTSSIQAINLGLYGKNTG